MTTRTEPTRKLCEPEKRKQFKYTPSEHTDVRRTFRKFRLLMRLQKVKT